MKNIFFLSIFILGFLGLNTSVFAQRELSKAEVKTSKQVKAPVKIPVKIQESFQKKYGKKEIAEVKTMKQGEKTIYRVYYRTSQKTQELSWSDFDEFGKILQEGKGEAVEQKNKSQATE